MSMKKIIFTKPVIYTTIFQMTYIKSNPAVDFTVVYGKISANATE